MTISIWRYSHLALAISSSVFIILASITGVVLAFQPISEQLKPYKVAELDKLTLAQTITTFQRTYPEIIELKIDANDFVIASVFTKNGNNLQGYFNPETAEYLGEELKPSPFFQWVTNFHRSLFLKSVGRFFVGLSAFLLGLIVVTGSILIIKRQRGVKRFFSKIVNENFNQYWHVVLGRLSLIPIVIITCTGVYLSLEKFDLLPKSKETHNVDYESISNTPKREISNFDIFKKTSLSDIEFIEFPFSSDVEDFFTLKLHDKEVLINQYTGDVLSEIDTSKVEMFSALSLKWHTGKGSVIWSLVLLFATLNILFFVYSGFAMTLKRRKIKLKNKFKAKDAEIIILVGSENGSTINFANTFYKQLIAQEQKAFIAEMNAYQHYPKAKRLVILTATYGQGEAPTNANQFFHKLNNITNSATLKFSVVGFGSLAYPDFCKFAYDVEHVLQQKMQSELSIFTVNDKSIEAFEQWVNQWSNVTQISLSIPKDELCMPPKNLKKLKVIAKTDINQDDTFLMTLKSKVYHDFSSGDLLAIYPKNDYRERLYSIGKVNGNIQLSIKRHAYGLGSGFLYQAKVGSYLKARLVKNSAFHFPKKAKQVIMIANGTGIAPFLGMLQQNKNAEIYLYYGLRTQKSYRLYKSHIDKLLKNKRLNKIKLTFSREGVKQYVQDTVKQDAEMIAKILDNGGVIMICGSLAMYKDLISVLEHIVLDYNNKELSYYINKSQIKSDCY